MKSTIVFIFVSLLLAACGDDSAGDPDATPIDIDAATTDVDAIDVDAAPTPCDPNPCMNSGVCTPAGASFTCDCAGTGFTGDLCELTLAISINFDDTATLVGTDSAGRPGTETVQWNNALGAGAGQGDNGALADLVDEANAATGVSLAWTCQDIEITAVTAGSPGNQAMMRQGCRSWLGMGDASITLTGLDAHFPGGYDVVLFVGHGGGFPTDHMATFNLTAGSDTLAGAVLAAFDGTFDTLDGTGDPGNVYVSAAHSEDVLTIGLAATGAATLPTAAINGIQLIAR